MERKETGRDVLERRMREIVEKSVMDANNLSRLVGPSYILLLVAIALSGSHRVSFETPNLSLPR